MKAALHGHEPMRGIAWVTLVLALPLALGVAVVNEPQIVLPLMMLIAVAIWFAIRARLAWWDLLVFVVAGAYVLDYGFANVGIPGSVPVPIVDVVAAVLVIRILTRPGFRLPDSLPFVLAAAFVGLNVVRLSVDLPHYGILAVRDATLGVEISFLLIGYWAIKEYGLQRFVRMLSVVFVIAIAYFFLFPLRDAILVASPKVGLQQPVSLFGNFQGGAVVAAAFFFFALVRPYGRLSYALAAATLPLLAMVQVRALYISMPAVIFLIWVLGRAHTGAQIRRGLAATLAVGVLALALFLPIAPEGRLGEVTTPRFVLAQLETLSGREGPSSKTVDVRKDWFRKVMRRVNESPGGWAVGVGLGPDLAFGIKNEGVLLRKPHNDYLEIYARFGVLGLALFVCMLGVAFARIVRAARLAEGLAGRFLWFSVAQTAALALLAATQPFLSYPYATVPLFVILGAALAIAERPSAYWTKSSPAGVH